MTLADALTAPPPPPVKGPRLCRKGLHDMDVVGRHGKQCLECYRAYMRSYLRAYKQTPEYRAYMRAYMRAYHKSPLGYLTGYVYKVRKRIGSKEAQLEAMTNGT